MAYTPVPTVLNGQILTQTWAVAVETAIEELQAESERQAWSPTLTNATVTNTRAGYARIGDLMIGSAVWTVSAVSGDLSCNLPETIYCRGVVGNAHVIDANGTRYLGGVICLVNGSAGVVIRGVNSSVAVATETLTSSTVPMTWAAGDMVAINFAYLVG